MYCRILIVDDNPVYLDVAARVLDGSEGIEVVGRASSGPDALEKADRLRPDLILMDLSMPVMGGLEVTRRLLARPDAPRILIMSLHVDPEYRAATERSGADGFLTKSEIDTSLIPMIDRLSSGRTATTGGPDRPGGLPQEKSSPA